MESTLILIAVPLLLAVIGVEALVVHRRGGRYRLNDALTNLACGATQQLGLVLWGGAQLAAYAWVYEHRCVSWDAAWAPWLVAFVGVDFLYYWWHRMSHEVNVLWASHVVHHSSEELNLSVALRQPFLTGWPSLPFFAPLALLGVPTLVFGAMLSISTLYQFWIHTRLVPRVRGRWATILNLPEHHRVHHAINPQYLDKNYGAIFMIWDRMFGTYAQEVEEPVFGITHPLRTFGPLSAQLHAWTDLVTVMRRAPRWRDRLTAPLRRPAWRPDAMTRPPGKSHRPGTPPIWDPATPARRGPLVIVAAVATIATLALAALAPRLTLAVRIAGAAAITGAFVALGRALDRVSE